MKVEDKKMIMKGMLFRNSLAVLISIAESPKTYLELCSEFKETSSGNIRDILNYLKNSRNIVSSEKRYKKNGDRGAGVCKYSLHPEFSQFILAIINFEKGVSSMAKVKKPTTKKPTVKK